MEMKEKIYLSTIGIILLCAIMISGCTPQRTMIIEKTEVLNVDLSTYTQKQLSEEISGNWTFYGTVTVVNASIINTNEAIIIKNGSTSQPVIVLNNSGPSYINSGNLTINNTIIAQTLNVVGNSTSTSGGIAFYNLSGTLMSRIFQSQTSSTISVSGGFATGSTITSSISTSGKGATAGFSQSGSTASSLVPEQDSLEWRLSGQAYSPAGVATVNSMGFRLIQISNASPVKSRMSLKMVTDAGNAASRELATITSDGDMHLFSNRFGPECLTNGAMSSAANWSVTGGWAYTTGDFTYTTTAGLSTLRQNTTNMIITFKPYTWYYVSYTVGVSAPAGTLAWIGTESAEYTTYFSMSTTEVPFFFRTGANPTDFVIYTNATTTSGFRIDDMSIKEVYGGNIHAGIANLDNISMHASDNYSQIMCIKVNSTGSITAQVGVC